jgi:MoxR-like ATPase
MPVKRVLPLDAKKQQGEMVAVRRRSCAESRRLGGSAILELCGTSHPYDGRATAYVRDHVAWGAGPRGSQYLVLAAKARALPHGRAAPPIEDVRSSAVPVLRHRIVANHRAVSDGIGAGAIVDHLLREVPA